MSQRAFENKPAVYNTSINECVLLQNTLAYIVTVHGPHNVDH